LLEKGLAGRAIAYVAMNNIISIGAAGIGYKVARSYFPRVII
jgi:hypothetical protein